MPKTHSEQPLWGDSEQDAHLLRPECFLLLLTRVEKALSRVGYMMYAETAKSRHAIRLLEKTGVLDEIEQIVWGCASDAFGEDCYKYDFETYAKSGTYYFLHHRFPIGARHSEAGTHDDAGECRSTSSFPAIKKYGKVIGKHIGHWKPTE